MNEWPTYTVADLQSEGVLLVEDGNHGEYRPRPNEFVEEGVRFIRATDMADGQVLFDDAGRINDVAFQRVRKGVGGPGDILFSHKGTVGKLARVPLNAPPFVCSPQTTFWRVLDQSRLQRDYLYAFMRSQLFIDQWWIRKGETDMADYVSLTAQRQLRISLPPIDVQRQIAEPLCALDDLIENNQRRIELLEHLAKAIYREWFVNFRYPGYEEATFIDSTLGPVPDGWEVIGASELLEINPRLRLNKNVDRPFITMADLSGRNMDCVASEKKTGSSGAKFQNGDTLFARITPCLENGKTGLVQCLDEDEIGRGSTEFIVLRGRHVGQAFTYFLARDDRFRRNAIQSMSGASGRQRVRNECFDSFLVAAPPAGLAQYFEETCAPSLLIIYSLGRWNQLLGRIRNLLLPRLVNGRINLTDMNADHVVEHVA